MNAIDGLFNLASGFLEKVAKWIPKVDLPWSRLTSEWSWLTNFIHVVNSFFPMTDLFAIVGIVISFLTVMLIIWTIKFLKEMLSVF